MPDEFITCPECGTKYPASGMGGFSGMCPRCMIAGVSGNVLQPDEADDRKVGNYHLEERIGVGGMGTVWRATQFEPVRREVAVKIIKLGMDTEEVVARFENERQALAAMDHPNIAVVFDAGATAEGRPYFVMELIKGEPIVSFCKRHKLDLTARLRLFMQLCAAVEHAHQKGIIHRDLKPSNVLVAGTAGEPVVKVIDFGVAKATEQHEFEYTMFTQAGQMIGTPAYMSPEQAGATADIDVRSDVYALGVLFYEILVGRPPFEDRVLRTAMIEESRRIIREVDPPRPSTVAGQPGSVRPHDLAGDLDWITMKALEKDRDRRYGSAAAFGEDIQRFFNNEPVTAAAPSAIYRSRKFCRKYRRFLLAVAAVVVALGLGGVMALQQARRAERATVAEHETKLDALKSLADSYVNAGLHAGDIGDYGRAQLWFTEAAEVAAEARVPTLERACRLRAAMFERAGPVPLRSLPINRDRVEFFAAEFDGKLRYLKVSAGDFFMAASLESETLADLGTGETDFHAVDFSPDGATAALSIKPGKIRIVGIAGKTMTQELELPDSETKRRLTYLRYSRDGRYLFCAAGSGWIRDLQEDAWLEGAIPFTAPVRWARFSPHRNRLMTMEFLRDPTTPKENNPVSIFEIPGETDGPVRKPLFEPVAHRSYGNIAGRNFPDFSEDGSEFTYLGGPENKQHFIVADAGTGRQISISSEPDVARVSGDRSVFCTGYHGYLLDAKSGARIRSINQRDRFFTGDGSSLMAADLVYDIDTAEIMHRLRPYPFTSAGEAFANSADGSLTTRKGVVWGLARPSPYFKINDRAFAAFSFSPSGDFLLPGASIEREGIRDLPALNVYSCQSGNPVASIPLEGKRLIHACFSPQGDERVAWAAVDGEKGTLHFRDWRKNEDLISPVKLPTVPRFVAIHPSEEWIAVLCTDRQVLRVSLATGKVTRLFEMEDDGLLYGEPEAIAGQMEFLDGGNDLAVWGLEAGFHMWDVPLGKIRYKIQDGHYRSRLRHAGDVMLSTTYYERDINPLFDRKTGAPLPHRIPKSKLRATRGSHLSSDGDLLLWADNRSDEAVLWNWRTGERLTPPIRTRSISSPHGAIIRNHSAMVITSVAGTRSREGEIGFYDIHDGKPLCPNVKIGLKMTDLRVSPCGRYLACSLNVPYGTGTLFDLDAWFSEGTHAGLGAEARMMLAEINAQARIVDGTLEQLTFEEWSERWREFRKRHPDYHPLQMEKSEMMRWHRNSAARPFVRTPPLDWHRKRLEALEDEGR